jgi:hypothetical protein
MLAALVNTLCVVTISIKNCAVHNCGGAAIATRGPINGLNVDGLMVTNTPTVLRADGPLRNSSFRRIVHRPGTSRPRSTPILPTGSRLTCWCNSGRPYRECHGENDIGKAA